MDSSYLDADWDFGRRLNIPRMLARAMVHADQGECRKEDEDGLSTSAFAF
jgi:hypothetical protein